MAETTGIEWTDATFNPWTGCLRVSPGCDHCYAAAMAGRNGSTFGSWEPGADRKRTSKAYWNGPAKWNRKAIAAGKRVRVFCASMADVFDNRAPISWLVDLLEVVRQTTMLVWQILTKRAQLIRRRLEEALRDAGVRGLAPLCDWISAWLNGAPPPNVWLGTTVENQTEADRRIPHLLAVPAARRFLSCEPLLGPVDLTDIQWPSTRGKFPDTDDLSDSRTALRMIEGSKIDWIIAGGESGPGSRPAHPDWFRSLRDQCQAAGVPFFFKQHGDWIVPYDGARACRVCGCTEHWACEPGSCSWVEPDLCSSCVGKPVPALRAVKFHRVGKKAAGDLLDGVAWKQMPAVVAPAAQ